MLLSATLMANANVVRQELDSGWQFRQNRKVQWHPASVPGTVHTDLMAANMIPDPFVGENERLVQWVDKEDWIYETRFDLTDSVAASEEISLVFEGLDTYADVYLNDSLILRADNMFRRWEVPVASLLRPTDNLLRVYFHSPLKIDLPKYEALGFDYPYPASNDQSQNGGLFNKQVSVFARKAGYHYGWDWGPRLVTSGIWRPVYLRAWSGPKIDDVAVRTLSLARSSASMLATVEVSAPTDMPGYRLTVTDQSPEARTSKPLASVTVDLHKGLNSVEIPFTVKNPRIWWCNGMGPAELYDFGVSLTSDDKTVADETTVTTGIRTIELVRDDDADGRSFYFRLNGEPVFAKGANYIPCDNFLPRVTTDVYRRTVSDAADANMNMLRVWGGGIYEDDRFYRLCDSLGIMVWQDFMFACSMYPTEGALLDNIGEEARDNVRRLRNHPSIAVWCGNNECLDAWYGWGWRRRAEKAGVDTIMRRQYDALYFDLLPRVVAELTPDVAYTPSSPFSRPDGPAEPERGDCHLWTVWGAGAPISEYDKRRSRFFSEYGFQSFPEIETVMKYAPDTTQHFLDSDVMLAHQRAGAGANRKIEKYLLDAYPQPRDFASLLYMTQVQQGDAIRTAIESHRRDRPHCMGSLFWQHNDCWPVASWSSRDYFGRWKAQHYFARKAYRDILLSVMPDSAGGFRLSIVSDRRKAAAGRLTVELCSLDGKVLATDSRDIAIAPAGVTTIDLPSSLTAGANPAHAVLLASLRCGSDSYDALRFLAPQKDIDFPEATISCDVAPLADGLYAVTLTTDRFVRALRLTLGDGDYFFTDNYFDLIPGRPHRIELRSSLPLDEVRRRLHHTDLRRASAPAGLTAAE